MAINPYVKYPGKVAAPSSSYPYGEARNVTVQGDGTGSPWDKDLLNDLWALFQRMLTLAGIAPSGSADTALVSQLHDALRGTAGVPGMLVPLVLNKDPSNYDLRILICDGSAVLRTSYPELDEAVYCGDANNATASSLFHTTGLTRDINGPYLRLPNLEGRFLRGLDTDENRDEDGASRIVGNYQDPAVAAHDHELIYEVLSQPDEVVGPRLINYPATGTSLYVLGENSGGTARARDITTANGRVDDNRPYNMAVNWGIWY